MFFSRLAAKSKDTWSSFTRRSHRKEHSDTAVTPDMLFILPYDLLELIATVYFQRREAVKVLRVNSQFHAAFSRAVWRDIFLMDFVLDKFLYSAWKNYGHLVRVMNMVQCDKKVEIDADLLPNLVELRIACSQLVNSSFGQTEFRKLRRLTLVIYEGADAFPYATKCVNLVQQWIQQSSCSLHANWIISATSKSWRGDLKAIDDMLSKIGATEVDRHSFSFSLNAEYPATLKQLPILADSLTELRINRSIAGLDCFFNSEGRNRSNNNRNGVVYPRLKKLDIDVLVPPQLELQPRVSNIAPNWLPKLEELKLSTGFGALHPSWFVDIFEHTWTTLTTMKLSHYYSAVDFQTVISHTPNLLSLSLLWCAFTLDVSVLTTHAPQLKDLSLVGKLILDVDSLYQQQQQQHQQHRLTALKSLCIWCDYGDENDAFTPKNTLQFIIHAAPILECVKLYRMKSVWESDLDNVHGMVNPTVRELCIYSSIYDLDFEMVLNVILLFPNLVSLEIMSERQELKTKLRQLYPNLIIK